MFVAVWRTVVIRVTSDRLIEFKEISDEGSHGQSLWSRFETILKGNGSLFSFADRGQWRTVQSEDEGVQREAGWFRIGFEPLFVDFTQKGAWFGVLSLVEVCMEFTQLRCAHAPYTENTLYKRMGTS